MAISVEFDAACVPFAVGDLECRALSRFAPERPEAVEGAECSGNTESGAVHGLCRQACA